MTVWAIDFFVMKVLHVITSLLTGGGGGVGGEPDASVPGHGT